MEVEPTELLVKAVTESARESLARRRRTVIDYPRRIDALSRVAELALANGAEVDTKVGMMPIIFFTAQRGPAQMLKILLDNGGDPNAADYQERTALEAASWDPEMVKLLKAAGAY